MQKNRDLLNLKNLQEPEMKIFCYNWLLYMVTMFSAMILLQLTYIRWPCLVLQFCYNWLLYMVTMFSATILLQLTVIYGDHV
jgi:hypothetical protein